MGVAIPAGLVVGELARRIASNMKADALGIPAPFVPSSSLEGAVAFGAGVMTWLVFVAIGLWCWRWAGRGGLIHVIAAVGVPGLVAFAAPYGTVWLTREGHLSYASQLLTLAALAFVLAVVGVIALLTRLYKGILSRSRPPSRRRWRAKFRGASVVTAGRLWRRALEPRPHATQREVSVTAVLLALALAPVFLGGFVLILAAATEVTYSSSLVDGVSARGAFVKVTSGGRSAEDRPARLTLVYLDHGGMAAFRRVAQSPRNLDTYVPCGPTVVRPLAGLRLRPVPDRSAQLLQIGSLDPADRPLGCEDPPK